MTPAMTPASTHQAPPAHFPLGMATIPFPNPATVSPLTVADRLLALAEEADRAGLREIASHLLGTMYGVLDGVTLRQ